MTGLSARLAPPAHLDPPDASLGLRWRPLRCGDAPELAAFIAQVQAHDRDSHLASAAEIADLMEGCTRTGPVETLLGVAPDGRLAAMATVKVHSALTEHAVAELNAFVDPAWRARGIGRELLRWQDDRARQLLVAGFGADATIPATLAGIVDAGSERAALFAEAGFAADRTFQVMYRGLDGTEEATPPRGDYRILPWTQAPLTAVAALHDHVFVDHYWPGMRGLWWTDAVAELEPRWSFAALSPTGEVAGYIVVTRPVDRWVAQGRTEAYISLVGVSAQHRGKSLASALMTAAIAAAARSGIERIGLDVDLDSPSSAHAIYQHLGFTDERTLIYRTRDY